MPQNINVNTTVNLPQVAGAGGGVSVKNPNIAPSKAFDPNKKGAYQFITSGGDVMTSVDDGGGIDLGALLPWLIAIAAIAAVLWALAQANSARDRAARAEEEARRAQAAARPQAQRRPPRPAQ